VKYTFRHREAEWNEVVAISLFNEKKGEIASSSRIFSGIAMTVFAFIYPYHLSKTACSGARLRVFNQRIPRCSASGFPNNSLPIEGGGLGWGCFVMIIFDTLPFTPSSPRRVFDPRGRGDIRYLVPKAFGTAG